jgi:Ala-tRNA(Pro) deacylase
VIEMTVAASVVRVLVDHGAEYDLVPHPKSLSSIESAKAAHVPEDHIAKGVLLKDRTGYVLAVIPASEWIDLRRLQAELGRDLNIAPENEVDRLFNDCAPGAVPPLGEAYGLEMVLDESLISLSSIYFEGGDHENLVRLDGNQFNALMLGVRRGHISNAM